MSKRLQIGLRWLNLLLVGGMLLAYWSPYISPKSFWPVSLFGLGFPWLLLGNVIMVLVWTFLKKWNALFSLVVLLLGWSHIVGFVGLNLSGTSAESKGNTLKVMTFNSGAFYYLYKQNPKKENSPFFEFLAQENPDIICFQEFTYRGARFNDYKDSIQRRTGLKYFKYSENKKFLIASRHPLGKAATISFPQTSNGALYADMQMGGKKIRIFNLHLQSNKISPQTDKLAKQGDLQEKETWLEIGSILKKNKLASGMRARQAEEIARQIKASPYPVLVMGDFNDTPLSYAYRILSDSLIDGFKERGLGLGTTYAGSIPALRIDYILADAKLSLVQYKIHRKDFSDHYPVTATIKPN